MNKHEYERMQTYLAGQEKLQKLADYYKNMKFKEADHLLISYENEYLNTNMPYLLYKICFKTENTILHEISLIMRKDNFKELFRAIHTILQYHPELATQENSDSCLPLNYATEIVEHQMETLCLLMLQPKKFKTSSEYLLEKLTKPIPISIKQSINEKEVDEKNNENDQKTNFKKASSFNFLSFPNTKKSPHSNSLGTISRLNQDKN